MLLTNSYSSSEEGETSRPKDSSNYEMGVEAMLAKVPFKKLEDRLNELTGE